MGQRPLSSANDQGVTISDALWKVKTRNAPNAASEAARRREAMGREIAPFSSNSRSLLSLPLPFPGQIPPEAVLPETAASIGSERLFSGPGDVPLRVVARSTR